MAQSEERPWHEPRRWLSPSDYWDEDIQQQIPAEDREIKIIDCTLSEGEDMVGKHLGWNEWIRITEGLDELGVDVITDPMGQSPDVLQDYVEEVRSRGVSTSISHKCIVERIPLIGDRWERKLEARLEPDMDEFILLGVWPKEAIWNDFEGKNSVDKSEISAGIEQYTSRAVEISEEKGNDADIIFSFPYSFNHRVDTLVQFAADGVNAGASGIYLYDSMGQSNPLVTRNRCSAIKAEVGDANLYVQHHNDLGMSTACSLAAAEGGADYIDAAMCAVGDRAGTAPLEEVACSLEAYGWETNINLAKLNGVAEVVNDAFDLKFSPHKPVIGSQINMEEGLGHQEEDDPPESSMAIAGDLLGRPFESVIGWNIFCKYDRLSQIPGEDAADSLPWENFLGKHLDRAGYNYTEGDIEEIKDRTIDQLMAPRGYIKTDEFDNIVAKVLE
jgi:methanogen homocitrate synthase